MCRFVDDGDRLQLLGRVGTQKGNADKERNNRFYGSFIYIYIFIPALDYICIACFIIGWLKHFLSRVGAVGRFLELVKTQLSMDFPDVRGIGVDSLLYVKEDLIIPHVQKSHESLCHDLS